MVAIDFKLADIKIERSKAYLLKLKMRFEIYADISNVSIPTRE